MTRKIIPLIMMIILLSACGLWAADISVVNSATAYGTASPLAIAAPASCAAGDVLIAHIQVYYASSQPTITNPANWTTVGTDTVVGTYAVHRTAWHVFVAGETTYSWTFSNSSYNSGGIIAFRNVNSASPIGATTQASATTGTRMALAAVATVAENSMLVQYDGAYYTSNLTWSTETTNNGTAMTEKYDIGSSRCAGAGSYYLQAAIGSSGTNGATVSGTMTSMAGRVTVLRPLNQTGAPTFSVASATTHVSRANLQSPASYSVASSTTGGLTSKLNSGNSLVGPATLLSSSFTCNLSLTSGYYFITNPSISLAPYVGRYLRLFDGTYYMTFRLVSLGTGESLSGQMVTNGNFSDGSGWTMDANWSIGGGVATSNGSNGLLHQPISWTQYALYKDTYTVVRNSGTVRIQSNNATFPSVTSSGTFIQYLTQPFAGQTDYYINSYVSFNGNVSSVSLYQVLAPVVTGALIDTISMDSGFNTNATSYVASVFSNAFAAASATTNVSRLNLQSPVSYSVASATTNVLVMNLQSPVSYSVASATTNLSQATQGVPLSYSVASASTNVSQAIQAVVLSYSVAGATTNVSQTTQGAPVSYAVAGATASLSQAIQGVPLSYSLAGAMSGNGFFSFVASYSFDAGGGISSDAKGAYACALDLPAAGDIGNENLATVQSPLSIQASNSISAVEAAIFSLAINFPGRGLVLPSVIDAIRLLIGKESRTATLRAETRRVVTASESRNAATRVESRVLVVGVGPGPAAPPDYSLGYGSLGYAPLGGTP